MRRFSLYLRNGVYYAQLYNPKSGSYLYGRSTGKANRDEAAGIATDWLKNGIPVPKTKQKRSIEPPRVHRRPFYLSPAPTARTSCSV